MFGSAQPDRESPLESGHLVKSPLPTNLPEAGPRALGENDLQAALQLLVERAQYVTGATGAALALLDGEDMVCRASTGRSAPAVGARLQVRSGLTGESISRRQLLRCDNAEADTRVNLEACRELGIASIVVMPLLTHSGEARGLFELFSDHPYAFEERDLIALERMAELTRTALDLPAKLSGSSVALGQHADIRVATHSVDPLAAGANSAAGLANVSNRTGSDRIRPDLSREESGMAPAPQLLPETLLESLLSVPEVLPTAAGTGSIAMDEGSTASPGAVPDAMRRIQKCASCGFPVSEGRRLCLDCEKMDCEKMHREKTDRAKPDRGTETRSHKADPPAQNPAPSGSADAVAAEFLPKFLADTGPQKESWLADHVNVLAVVVLFLCILVAVVVFR